MTYFICSISMTTIRRNNEQSRRNSSCILSIGEMSFMNGLCLIGANKKCEYGSLRDEMIRDRTVVGIRDATLAFKLQLDAELTVEKALKAVWEAETIKKQQSLMRAAPGQEKVDTTATVGAVQQRQWHIRRPRMNERPVVHRQAENRAECSRCGKLPPHDRRHCPAKNEIVTTVVSEDTSK